MTWWMCISTNVSHICPASCTIFLVYFGAYWLLIQASQSLFSLLTRMNILNMSRPLLDNYTKLRFVCLCFIPPLSILQSTFFSGDSRLYHDLQMEELRAESQQPSESTGTIGRSKGASAASSHQQISVTVVTEFVRWNEEAISRCTLFSSLVIFNSAISLLLRVLV